MRSVALILSLLGLLLASAPAAATPYLVRFTMNNAQVGYFRLDVEGEEAHLSPRAFSKLGIPAQSPTSVDVLKQYGPVELDLSSQSLLFRPEKEFERLFLGRRNSGKAEVPAEGKTAGSPLTLSLKNLDYQAQYSTGSSGSGPLSLYGTLTGRLGVADVDLALANNGSRSGVWSANYHDEAGTLFKDFQIGRTEREGFDGFALTNEPWNKAGGTIFGMETARLYYPPDSRVQIYRNGLYIGESTVGLLPFELQMELLSSSSTVYRLLVYRPDGQIEEELIERKVAAALAPVGHLEYRLAGGRVPGTGEEGRFARLTYGLTSRVSLEGVYTTQASSRLGLSVQPVDDLVGRIFILDAAGTGYEASATWTKGFSLTLQAAQRDKSISRSLFLSVPAPLSPQLSASHNKSEGRKEERAELRLFGAASRGGKTLNLNPSIAYERTVEAGRPARQASFALTGALQGLFRDFRIVADYEYRRPLDIGDSSESLSVGLVQRLDNAAEIRLEQDMSRDEGKGWKGEQTSLSVNLFGWDKASLNARASYRPSHGEASDDWSLSMGITGSLTRQGALREGQSKKGMIEVKACFDEDANGRCEEDEEGWVPPLDVEIDGKIYTVKNGSLLVPSLPAYQDYKVEVVGEPVGFALPWRAWEVENLCRGKVAAITLPLQKYTRLKGFHPSGQRGKGFRLVDKKTGEIAHEGLTRSDGYWSVQVPSHEAESLEFRPL